MPPIPERGSEDPWTSTGAAAGYLSRCGNSSPQDAIYDGRPFRTVPVALSLTSNQVLWGLAEDRPGMGPEKLETALTGLYELERA